MNVNDLKKVENKQMQIIADELLKRAEKDECLMNKLIETNKTIKECFKYIKEQAQKKAIDGCCFMQDDEVYQLAQHFFLEDEIKTEFNNSTVEEKQEIKNDNDDNSKEENIEKKSKKEIAKEKLYGDIDLFSL